MSVAPSIHALDRAAAQAVARRRRLSSQPIVLWADVGEASSSFAARCANVAARGRVLAAVTYGFQVPHGVQAIEFPEKHFDLLHPSRPSRYRAAAGGRGSGKSHSIAAAKVLHAYTAGDRILCAREYQASLRESVHHLLVSKIESFGLTGYFDITDRAITCRTTGAEILFMGIGQNVHALKSLEDVKRVWIEEAQSVSARSFEVLSPTIRSPGSEIWLSWNPDSSDAPVQQFADPKRSDTRYCHTTYRDNPWLSPELESERAYLARVDDDSYRHVWEGEFRRNSSAQVFARKFVVEEFTVPRTPSATTAVLCFPQGTSMFVSSEGHAYRPTDAAGHIEVDPRLVDEFLRAGFTRPAALPSIASSSSGWSGPYFGADWGFSQDPTTLVKCWVRDRTLYIEYEAYGIGVDIHMTPQLFDGVPGAREHAIRADSARPETVSYMQAHGYPRVMSVPKWKGSVEDGIAHIRSYERVVIHPRCEHTIAEFRLYSYKVDRLTGDVLPDLVDANNHTIDAIRYALQPLIKSVGGSGFLRWMAAELESMNSRKAAEAAESSTDG